MVDPTEVRAVEVRAHEVGDLLTISSPLVPLRDAFGTPLQ